MIKDYFGGFYTITISFPVSWLILYKLKSKSWQLWRSVMDNLEPTVVENSANVDSVSESIVAESSVDISNVENDNVGNDSMMLQCSFF